MKRIGLIVTVIVLASALASQFSFATASAREFSLGESVAVDTDSLNLRSEPGLNADVIDVLSTGTSGDVIAGPVSEDGYLWYELELGDGASGWAAGEFLSSRENGGFESGAGVRVIAGSLNVRDEPNLDGAIHATVEEGAVLTIAGGPIVADGYTWYRVRSLGISLPLEGNTGWAAGEFLVYDGGVTGCEGQGPCPGGIEPGNGIRVATDALNLREAPGTASAVLAVLPQGTTGVVSDAPEYVDGIVWIEVESDGYGSGWVARQYIVADAGAGGDPEFVSGDEVEVFDGALSLRSSATTAAGLIAVMDDGEVLTVLGGPVFSDGYVWYRVTSGDYGAGWAAGEYLRLR